MAGKNNNLDANSYVKQYAGILKAVFNVKRAFPYAFSDIQVLDGVTENAVAFTVKTNNTPVVVNTYNTGANIGMGTGTSGSSRFGACTEIIYGNTDVPYSYNLSIHEGLDKATVNSGLEEAVASRLELQSIAQVKRMNVENGKFISAAASKIITLVVLEEEHLVRMFDDAYEHFIEKEVDASLTAYVAPDLFNIIVNSKLTTTSKRSTVNIDDNTVHMFKGFKIVPTPNKYFVPGEHAYIMADEVIVPFVGASTARVVPTEDFDGVKLQARAKGGSFVLDDNKVAIIKFFPRQ